VAPGSNPAQRQATQAPEAPTWGRGLGYTHGKGSQPQRHMALGSALRKGKQLKRQEIPILYHIF